MIPKTIHYCWFGKEKKPRLVKKCIRSWKRLCPDYQIIEWNEANYDLSSAPAFVKQAMEAGKWAFATDYIRLDLVYKYGGFYLDADVLLLKRLDVLRNNELFFGFMDLGESDYRIATGLGFGGVKNASFLSDLMGLYKDEQFTSPERYCDVKTCSKRETELLCNNGLVTDGTEQMIDGYIHIYPTDFLCPLNQVTRVLKKTQRSISVHWGFLSWIPEDERRSIFKERFKIRADYHLHFLNRICRKVFGEQLYNDFKKIVG